MISAEVLPAQEASLLILAVLDLLLSVMTALVGVALLNVTAKDLELVLHPVVRKLALLAGACLTLEPLLLLVLSLLSMHRDCSWVGLFSDMHSTLSEVLAFKQSVLHAMNI